MKKFLFIIPAIALLFYGCSSGDLPVKRIKNVLRDSPSFSIILEDMKEEGNFFTHYFHKYRVVQDDKAGVTGWEEVPKNYYKQNESFLGMSLASKIEGQVSSEKAPPGYQYVGNSQYGRWRDDHRGGSFWEFYGKYAFFSSMFGGWYRPIYRHDYNDYRRYRGANTPYFGSRNQYGTNGSIAKQAKPGFFNRRMTRERIKKTSFSDKVSRRTGRSRTGFRSRAGGFGK